MQWFSGGIAEGIQAAKRDNILFVVVIYGDDDENSKQFLELLDTDSITSKFPNSIAIKVKNGTEICRQFSQIYPVVLIPSIYFIDSSTGVDLEVTGGQVSREMLEASFVKVAERKSAPPNAAQVPASSVVQATTAPLAASDIASPRADRVEQARQILRSETAMTSEPKVEENSSDDSRLSLEDRVARAKRLLAERQAAKAEEEKEKEKNDEQTRREAGKALQEFKRKQEEDSLKKAAQERRKDKEEEKLARERVKAQIAQDRAERKARFEAQRLEEQADKDEREREALVKKAAEAEALAAARSTIARIQFRLPDGRNSTKQFPANAPLSDVYKFVREDIETGFRGFSLSTTFPRKQLDNEDMNSELKSLGLAPSATILVLPAGGTPGGPIVGGSNGIMAIVLMLLAPFNFLWNLVSSFFTPAPTASQPRQRKRSADERSNARNDSSTKRRANAGRFSRDGNVQKFRPGDDSDEENNTYNGNSTQQM